MRTRTRWLGLAVVALISGSVGCGNDDKPKKTPVSVLDTCTPAWSVVTPLNHNSRTMPDSMVWSEGQLYQASTEAISAMPAAGGPITTLVPEAYARSIWVEGNDLVYSTYKQVLKVPRSGGVPVPLLELPKFDDEQYTISGGYSGVTEVLGQDAYYWLSYKMGVKGISLWRASRATGTAETMATLPVGNIETVMALTPLGLLVAGDVYGTNYVHHIDAYLVPLNGDSPRPFTTKAPIFSITSVDATGLVWNSLPLEETETTYRWFSPVDGSPERAIDEGLPDFFIPMWGAPDGQGGHFLAGYELFENEDTHGSVFHVDAEGYARRLACNPESGFLFVKSSAVAPDAIYLTSGNWISGDASGWQIHKIPR